MRKRSQAKVRTWERRPNVKKRQPIPEKQESTGILRDEKGRFVAGVSGNPNGRPKKRTLSEAVRDALQAIIDSPFGDGEMPTVDVIAKAITQAGQSSKGGAPAWREIRELTEPKEIKVVTWRDRALGAIVKGEISAQVADALFGADLSQELFIEAGATYRIEAQPEGETDDGSNGQ